MDWQNNILNFYVFKEESEYLNIPLCFNFLFPQNTVFSRYERNPFTEKLEETHRCHYQGTALTYDLPPFSDQSQPLLSFLADQKDSFVDKINNVSFQIHKSSYKICKENHLDCPWLLRCEHSDNELIDIGKVCDFNIDYQDESDEKYCSSQTHFNCTRGSPVLIRRTKVGDSELDCSDQSDECKENLSARTRK